MFDKLEIEIKSYPQSVIHKKSRVEIGLIILTFMALDLCEQIAYHNSSTLNNKSMKLNSLELAMLAESFFNHLPNFSPEVKATPEAKNLYPKLKEEIRKQAKKQ